VVAHHAHTLVVDSVGARRQRFLERALVNAFTGGVGAPGGGTSQQTERVLRVVDDDAHHQL
jgi:hypothetical protein